MRYFLVEKGAIVDGPRKLPKSWRNVSGLDMASLEELVDKGWLPEEKRGHEPYDPTTQTRSGPVHVVESNKVVAQFTVQSKGQSELEEIIGAHCSLRIYAVVKDQITLMNMTAYGAELIAMVSIDGKKLTAEQGKTLRLIRDIRGWIESMQAVSRILIAASDITYQDDAHWPTQPEDTGVIVDKL